MHGRARGRTPATICSGIQGSGGLGSAICPDITPMRVLDAVQRARQDEWMATSPPLSNLAILAVLAFAAVYVVAPGTPRGLRLDNGAMSRHPNVPRVERDHGGRQVAVESVSIDT